jgi:hypothetical protein
LVIDGCGPDQAEGVSLSFEVAVKAAMLPGMAKLVAKSRFPSTTKNERILRAAATQRIGDVVQLVGPLCLQTYK